MRNLTLENLVKACNGRYEGKAEDLSREIVSITTDSRNAEKDGLFIAIKGERTDGHKYIPQVAKKGVLCVLAETEQDDPGVNMIYVDSCLQAVKDIAEFYRAQFTIPVIGITGSVGKTSTKEMIAAVLSQKYNTLYTLGNFNNELGLPLTVFRLREEHEIAVLEMGISQFGEMHRLAKVARPDTCVMTNIGQCHLEFLGDRDGILRAKSEIFDFFKPEGHMVLNGDDDKLATVSAKEGVEPTFFGVLSERSVYADEIKGQGLRGTSCRIHLGEESFEVLIPIPGNHMVYNALAGATVGKIYGLTNEEIKAGIESLKPVSGRFHIIDTEQYMVVDDCYNANPVSMKASIDVLASAEVEENVPMRKVAILGDMGELGENELEMHRGVGLHLAEKKLDVLYCVGTRCEGMAKAAQENDENLLVKWFETREELEQALTESREDMLKKGDIILVKASHFMHFEKIVELLSK